MKITVSAAAFAVVAAFSFGCNEKPAAAPTAGASAAAPAAVCPSCSKTPCACEKPAAEVKVAAPAVEVK